MVGAVVPKQVLGAHLVGKRLPIGNFIEDYGDDKEVFEEVDKRSQQEEDEEQSQGVHTREAANEEKSSTWEPQN